MKKRKTIAIDFDGTIVNGVYPEIKSLKNGAKKYINMLGLDYNIIINTCRTGRYEGEAKQYLDTCGVKYDYINCNIPSAIEYYKADCRKISADLYIDDKNLKGLPKTWKKIYKLVNRRLER